MNNKKLVNNYSFVGNDDDVYDPNDPPHGGGSM